MNQIARRNAETLAEWTGGPENVTLYAFNSLDVVTGYWSLMFGGHTVVLGDPRAAYSEAVRLVCHCDCSWIVCDQRSLAAAEEVAQGSEAGVIAVCEERLKLCRTPVHRRTRTNTPEVAVLAPTSGSTDVPRVAMLTHENVMANVSAHIEALRLRHDDVALIVLPMSYSYAHTAQFLTHTRLGGTIVLYSQPVFFPRLFCELIEKHRVTVTCLVPPLLRMLAEYPYLSRHDLRSLRYLCCGGAPLPLDAAWGVIEKLSNTRLVHTYGLTEAAPRVATLGPDGDLRKLPSIGKPLPGIEARIQSEAGQPGELLVRGRSVMSGYYKAPEETARVLRNGWLHTGDLAYRDQDGYIHLNGRKKNLIVTGGQNVSPEEVENVLRAHPQIDDAVVRGEPNTTWGEVPVAFLVLKKPESPMSLEQLHGFLRGRLADWKWPKSVYFRPEITRTASGKVRRQSVC